MSLSPIAILGIGKTGISCAHYLQRAGIPCLMLDTRATPPELAYFRETFPTIPVQTGENISLQTLKSIRALLVSPGLALTEPVIAFCQTQGIPVWSDIELFAQQAKAPLIAITGTNAKGTVTTLVSEMIKNAGYRVLTGGNIGTPALDLLAQPVPNFYVLEISSFQLETTHHLRAIAATILNMSRDHLDRHGTMENYHAIKQRIYRDCQCAVINRDDALSTPIYPTPKQISFGLSVPADHAWGIRERHLAYGEQLLLPCSALRIQGTHNWSNALAALAIGQTIGLDIPSMLNTLKVFSGLAHRCEWVGEKNQVVWYDDSKGTNVGATLAALEGLGKTLTGKIILIAGGIGKNADFSLLQSAVHQYVRMAILLGQDANQLANALNGYTQIQQVSSLTHAIAQAAQVAQPGDAVLLSPACASMDMFKDYADRGDQFKQFVREYLNHE